MARVATFSVQIRAKPFLGQGRIAGVCGRSTGGDRMGGIRPIEASKTVVSRPLYVDSGRPVCADCVEKLEFFDRSQFSRPHTGFDENYLGTQLGDDLCPWCRPMQHRGHSRR